jgi:hypothetical protein
MSDQLIAEASTSHHITQQTFIPPVEFEPTSSAGERLQTYALDRAATGTDNAELYCSNYIRQLFFFCYGTCTEMIGFSSIRAQSSVHVLNVLLNGRLNENDITDIELVYFLCN